MDTRLRMVGWATGLIGMALIGGCERSDPRLDALGVGISKDSVLAAMQGTPQKEEPYLVNSQYIEALFYPRAGKTDSVSLLPVNMTPVVMVNGKVTGWGWNHWDSLAAGNGIVVQKGR
jgi:hypothetical protein